MKSQKEETPEKTLANFSDEVSFELFSVPYDNLLVMGSQITVLKQAAERYAQYKSEVVISKRETPEKPDFDLIKWLEEERNILQNTGSLMWHKPAEQAKALEVAEHIDKTLQYIKLSGVASKEVDKKEVTEMIAKVHEDIEGRYDLDAYDKGIIHSLLSKIQ